MAQLQGKNILLIISGGIAAYKSLELIRLLKKDGACVKVVMTKGAQQFITPMSVAALSENTVYTDLWSLKDETEMGHIALSRQADIICIAPASANLLAKMAHGLADDLASTLLLASDAPIYAAPAMNVKMWENNATKDNVGLLKQRGISLIGPQDGDMACGEYGPGRMSDPEDILKALRMFFDKASLPLSGYKALVTSGPTYEAIDPVRFLGNRSSGKQGHAIAKALAKAGADVTLISGPVALADPEGVTTYHVESAQQMHTACMQALPVDIAVCAAAVADWTPQVKSTDKLKKRRQNGSQLDGISYKATPDILEDLSRRRKDRPSLVIGFAAETQNIETNATEKIEKKGCDILLVNDVSEGRIFGEDTNELLYMYKNADGNLNKDQWPVDSKQALAQKLVNAIIQQGMQDDRDIQNAAE